jgi:hypothetical protein
MPSTAGVDAVQDRQHRLAEHKRLRDAETAARQVGEVRAGARLRWWMAVGGWMVGAGLSDAWWAGAALAGFAYATAGRRWLAGWLALGGAACLSAGLLTGLTMSVLALVIGPAAVALGLMAWSARWLRGPGRLDARAEAIAMRPRAGDGPEHLVAIAEAQARASGDNMIVVHHRFRRWVLRHAMTGAVVAWTLTMISGFGSQAAVGSMSMGNGQSGNPLMAALPVALVGALAAAVLAWRGWGRIIGMLIYGLAVNVGIFTVIWLHLSGMSALMTLWCLAGAIIAGGWLGLMVETRDEAVVRRTL